ncbi:ATP-binding protein [Streptomyces sp. NBC_01264]|uniref:ATP-binding protein n=1 Tax=Streptomyces sp. NBC_01264 TaxID=2903804 RepID=UPI00224FD736|nr:ATP-binding protein [Streptomyces sp. NBC_01264]MCX4779248.1 ATP-binding protein [Streptomyces sp. NBC_01264]
MTVTTQQEADSTGLPTFVRRFTATAKGARLARHFATVELFDSGRLERDEEIDAVALVVAELASNAVRHGNVRGRQFEVQLICMPEVVRVAVSDARGDRQPCAQPASEGEGGHGMRLVASLSTAWGVDRRDVGKTVWADVPCGGGR